MKLLMLSDIFRIAIHVSQSLDLTLDCLLTLLVSILMMRRLIIWSEFIK